MAIIKCKMCGGDMELTTDKTIGTCEYCGTQMTLPKVDDDQRAAAFNRGNHFRRIGEFDKALAVYEGIVRQDDTDAEAHWCCALCRFGIEYVEDPATYEWIPTCHRASFDSFLEDVDYLAAVEYSDGITKRQYQKDAAKIAEVQKGILSTSQNEEPYDVFICYKESDENGERTRDSALAQDIYYQLTEQGRRVFFARISLEDVVGRQYEPYIFAALNSAKVMIVVGTKAEYLNAVWVKNEWSRFLVMMKKERSKLLLPCYRDMDPYDMPEQLSVLQSYDMSKIGFIQDLTRGIAKVLEATKKQENIKETQNVQQATNSGNGNIDALLDRGYMALEDKEWKKADGFFEEVLNQDSRNSRAYLGKFFVDQNASTPEEIGETYSRKTVEMETLIAVEEEVSRKQTALDNYTVERYLDRDKIEKTFAFDRTYQSAVSGWQDQLRNIEANLSSNKNWVRALSFAGGALKEELEAVRQAVTKSVEVCVEDAKHKDEQAILQIREAYAEHLDRAEEAVKELYAAANKKLYEVEERTYRSCHAIMERDNDELWRYEWAAKEFEKIKGYKDSAECAAKCWSKVKSMKDKERLESRIALGLCQYCGGEFKGLFTKTCSMCGRPKDY